MSINTSDNIGSKSFQKFLNKKEKDCCITRSEKEDLVDMIEYCEDLSILSGLKLNEIIKWYIKDNKNKTATRYVIHGSYNSGKISFHFYEHPTGTLEYDRKEIIIENKKNDKLLNTKEQYYNQIFDLLSDIKL